MSAPRPRRRSAAALLRRLPVAHRQWASHRPGLVRPSPGPSPAPARVPLSERSRIATRLDAELRLACRTEAMMRRELGCAARDLLRRRAYRRLGFVRLADYARERLGVSGRTVQAAAWLATRLDELPAVSSAFDRSAISWSQARIICGVASAGDQQRWLDFAARSTVETLEDRARRARAAGAADPPPADPDADGHEIDGEPAERWRLACPARVRVLWRRAAEMASRLAGAPLATWQAVESIAAEGFAGRPAGRPFGERGALVATWLSRRRDRPDPGASRRGSRDRDGAARDERGDDDGAEPHRDAASGPHPTPESTRSSRADAVTVAIPTPAPDTTGAGSFVSDPFALDARLVEAMRVLRTIEPRTGRLLQMLVEQRVYRHFGYTTLERYVRERLGISARKAWALLKVERATRRSEEFGSAYRDGRLSWVRSLALLPVLDPANAAAWVLRAEAVTHRRLCDEVSWVLAMHDAGRRLASFAPPPLDDPLHAPPVAAAASEECQNSSLAPALQIGAPWPTSGDDTRGRARAEIHDAEIAFTGPATVVALLRDALDAFAIPDTPRSVALERLLRHVLGEWESAPRHRDPVFARDGWRCTVPACSSRRNLHDHHIRFRSRGGDNARDNRTVVCAAHHLHGLHAGTIRAHGTAPDAIEWELGVRSGAPPLLRYTGDRAK